MVSITCKLTAGNVVLDVKLAKGNGTHETLDLQGNGEDWKEEKSVTFKQTLERASIWIHAEDYDRAFLDILKKKASLKILKTQGNSNENLNFRKTPKPPTQLDSKSYE